MGTIILGSATEQKGITVAPKILLYNGYNVSFLKKETAEIWKRTYNALIPVMTSNTAPSGIAYSDSVYPTDGLSYPAYKAMDNYTYTSWYSKPGVTQCYIQYKFTEPKIVKIMKWIAAHEQNSNPISYELQGSNDGSNFTLILSGENDNNDASHECIDNCYYNNDAYLYYRLAILSAFTTRSYTGLSTFQLYGY